MNEEDSPFSISLADLEKNNAPKDFHILLYSSILNVLSDEKLLNERIDEIPVICILFEGILHSAEQFTNR